MALPPRLTANWAEGSKSLLRLQMRQFQSGPCREGYNKAIKSATDRPASRIILRSVPGGTSLPEWTGTTANRLSEFFHHVVTALDSDKRETFFLQSLDYLRAGQYGQWRHQATSWTTVNTGGIPNSSRTRLTAS